MLRKLCVIGAFAFAALALAPVSGALASTSSPASVVTQAPHHCPPGEDFLFFGCQLPPPPVCHNAKIWVITGWTWEHGRLVPVWHKKIVRECITFKQFCYAQEVLVADSATGILTTQSDLFQGEILVMNGHSYTVTSVSGWHPMTITLSPSLPALDHNRVLQFTTIAGCLL